MVLQYQPDLEVFAILDGQVHGAHRVTHHALKPYVRIEPEAPGGTITVTANARLRLPGHVKTISLTAPMDFVILFDVGGIRLLPVSPPDPRVLPSSHRHWTIPEPMLVAPEPERQPETTPIAPRTLAVVPTSVEPPAPQGIDELFVPRHLEAFCGREGVYPALGDYLVVPPAAMSAFAPCPRWVVSTDQVDAVHVIKPRLREDRVVIP